jgi:hypothetical protein
MEYFILNIFRRDTTNLSYLFHLQSLFLLLIISYLQIHMDKLEIRSTFLFVPSARGLTYTLRMGFCHRAFSIKSRLETKYLFFLYT